MELPGRCGDWLDTATVTVQGSCSGSTRRARGGDFYLATSGDFLMATCGDFLMATDNRDVACLGSRKVLKHGKHRKAHAQWAGALVHAVPRPGRRAADEDVRPQGRRRAIPDDGRVIQADRLLYRPCGFPAHGRDLGEALARLPDALEAVDA